MSRTEAISTLANARFVDPSSTQVQATVATYAVPLAGAGLYPGLSGRAVERDERVFHFRRDVQQYLQLREQRIL
jgi:hypothetical protein